MSRAPVLILTAFELEYATVRRRLDNLRMCRLQAGTIFETGALSGTDCRIVLGQTGKGNHPAAVLAERAITHFRPAAVLFVGVAGALWDTAELGDVVVATRVYGYHGATSEDDGDKARPQAWEIPHAIGELARFLDVTGDWKNDPDVSEPAPRVHFAPVAAGEIVHNSRTSYPARWVREHFNDALAVEMEAAGAALAGHLNNAQVAVVRGISDRADGTKNTDGDRDRQPRAARNATAFAARLAMAITETHDEEELMQEREFGRGDITINANGQRGIVAVGPVTNSSVHSDSGPARPITGLADELATLRQRLETAFAEGSIDTDTFEETTGELGEAERALEDDFPDTRKRVVSALRKMKGLLENSLELAAQVATVIDAANGLS